MIAKQTWFFASLNYAAFYFDNSHKVFFMKKKHFYEEKTETFCVWRKIENTFKIKNQLIGQRSNCFPRNALDFNQCKLLNA